MFTELFTLPACLILGAILFALGAYGVAIRRNIAAMVMSFMVMACAAVVVLAAFSRSWGGVDGSRGHVFALIALGVAACQVAVGLTLAVAVYRRTGAADTERLSNMHD